MKQLRLYMISQDDELFDAYDAAVVAAYSSREAQMFHPDGTEFMQVVEGKKAYKCIGGKWDKTNWASHPSGVNVRLVGTAARGIKRGEIVCYSYNAG